MSASKKQKTTSGATHVQRRKHQQESKDRRKHILYGIVGGVLAVLAAALLIWDSGFFQKRAVAVTIDGEDFNTASLQYYYNSASSTPLYYAQMGMMPDYDISKSPKDQIKDQESGQTWHDYFMDGAIQQLTQVTMLNHAAQKAGYALSEQQQAYLDQQLAQLDTAWRLNGQYTSLKSYLRANYGPYMDEGTMRQLVSQQTIASFYQADHEASLTYSDDELNAYYQEHTNELDTFGYSVFTIQASVPPVMDDQGNPVEQTDEEMKAAFETAKADAEALAHEVHSKLLGGADPDALAKEYEGKLLSSSIHATDAGGGNALSSAPYASWLFDTARQSGDISLQENDRSESYVYNYYVVQFDSRQRDESATADVRHILVSAGSAPSEEDYAKAEQKAQEMLDQWKSSGGTEDDFAMLAVQNSADPGSQSTGGLYTGISASTGFIPSFTDWCLDPARQTGDTGLVKNDGSSTKGYHIMYFSGWNDPTWKLTVRNTLTSDAMTQWLSSLTSGVEAVRGSGANFI